MSSNHHLHSVVLVSIYTFVLHELSFLFPHWLQYFEKLRRRRRLPGQERTFYLLASLSLALFLLNLVLLISQIDQIKTSQRNCGILAIFIHLFLLSSFAWMMVEGIYLTIAVVKVSFVLMQV